MKNKIRFKRISNRHKQAIYFLFGIALGFGLIFFFVKDKFSTLEANESKNITIKEQTISQFPVRDSVYLDLMPQTP